MEECCHAGAPVFTLDWGQQRFKKLFGSPWCWWGAPSCCTVDHPDLQGPQQEPGHQIRTASLLETPAFGARCHQKHTMGHPWHQKKEWQPQEDAGWLRRDFVEWCLTPSCPSKKLGTGSDAQKLLLSTFLELPVIHFQRRPCKSGLLGSSA